MINKVAMGSNKALHPRITLHLTCHLLHAALRPCEGGRDVHSCVVAAGVGDKDEQVVFAGAFDGQAGVKPQGLEVSRLAVGAQAQTDVIGYVAGCALDLQLL